MEGKIEMQYKVQTFDHLYKVPGLSKELVANHLKLYQGYVANTNKLLEQLQQLQTDSQAYAALSRHFGWEFNGMRLHELYFANLTGQPIEHAKLEDLRSHIAEDFGSFEKWKADFMAKGALRGVGWAILYYDTVADRFLNAWVDRHDLGYLAGCKPLLVMDVWEHAYMSDYGLKRAEYIQTFMNAINWNIVYQRYVQTKTIV